MDGEGRRSGMSSLCGTPAADRHPMTGAFLRAAYEGNLEKVMIFIQDGVSVNTTNSAGLQALHFAAKSGHVEVANELINQGASVNSPSLKGHTPLHVASLLGQKEIVKLLLRKEADVNAQSQCLDDNFTPLYMAAQIGHQEIATLLLAHGADPRIATKNGSTPRDVASQQGYRALAELLEEYERRLSGDKNLSKSSDILVLDGPNRDSYARLTVRPPSVFNRDVIQSPRNSPMRGTTLDQYLRSTAANLSATKQS